MPRNRYLISAAALAASAASFGLAAPALAGGALPTVTVRIEGANKTLLAATKVTVPSGSITSGGAPSGACPGKTAQGALVAATKGKWVGKYYAKYKEFFITSILGEKPAGKGYWGLYVNGKYASTGACLVPAKAGQTILFADVPAKPTEYPIGITTPTRVDGADNITVKVVGYNAKGKASPLAGATVTVSDAGNTKLKTNAKGIATYPAATPGATTFTASKTGYIRAESVTDVLDTVTPK